MGTDKEKTFFGRRLFGGGSSCCCGLAIVSVRKIDVGGVEVEIKGLNETFEEYYYAGKKPEDLTGDELIEGLGELNHIAAGSAGAYKEAFLREYRKYYEGWRG